MNIRERSEQIKGFLIDVYLSTKAMKSIESSTETIRDSVWHYCESTIDYMDAEIEAALQRNLGTEFQCVKFLDGKGSLLVIENGAISILLCTDKELDILLNLTNTPDEKKFKKYWDSIIF